MYNYKLNSKGFGEFNDFEFSITHLNIRPSWLNDKGTAFAGLKIFLERCKQKYGPFKLIINKGEKIDFIKTNKTLYVGEDLLKEYKKYISVNRKESDVDTAAEYISKGPNVFGPQVDIKKGELQNILKKITSINDLPSSDQNAIISFLSNSMQFSSGTKQNSILKSQKTIELKLLEHLVDGFENKLKKDYNKKEEIWQEYFETHILFLIDNYIDLIDKEIINLDGHKPDIVLINIHNYIDIYEIKCPKVSILHKNRDFYYWDSEISQAISQVANYIYSIEQNSEKYIKKIKRKRKLNISVLKPKGIIIGGMIKDMDEQILNQFRIMNSALKDIEIIPYDELLLRKKNQILTTKKNITRIKFTL